MGNKCKKPRIVIGAGFIFNFVFPASGYACANTGVMPHLRTDAKYRSLKLMAQIDVFYN